LRHEALIYDDDQRLVDHVAPFLADGLAHGSPVVAVLSRRNWANVRDALGADADHVSFTDCDDFYVNPVDSIAAYDATLTALLAAGATSVRVTGEIPLGPTPAEWDKWTSYEALLNLAFADRPLDVHCLYDARIAPPEMLEGVVQTHRHLTGDAHEINPLYRDPDELVAALAPEPATAPDLRAVSSSGDPVALREALAAELAAAAVPPARAMHMLVAANELFANAVRHGGGVRAVRAGLVDDWFVVEVTDAGPGFHDPTAGFLPPRPDLHRGAGLWIARRLVSRLELLPADPGLTARLWL
jgi:anti-sigma regulatory factor (Ser/Thr protein kinase)